MEQKHGYVNSITLLRGVAGLLVCLLHLNTVVGLQSSGIVSLFLRMGNVGVYMFFIVSGFVIPYSLYKTDYNLNDFRRYFIKRSIRIDIPYWVSIALCFLCLQDIMIHFKFTELIYHIFYLVPFVKNAYWYNGSYWTLSIEMQFYVLLGILYPILMKTKPNLLLPILILTSLLFDQIRTKEYGGIICNYLSYFSIGFIAFRVKIKSINLGTALLSIALLILYVIFTASLKIGLFVTLTTLTILFLNFKRLPLIFKFLATISYSLYLIHYPIIKFSLVLLEKHNLNKYLVCIIILCACLTVATIFYWIVERPSLLLSKKYRKTLKISSEGLATSNI